VEKYLAKAFPGSGAVILALQGEKNKVKVEAESRGDRVLAVESTEEEKREETQPSVTGPLLRRHAIGLKMLPRIPAGNLWQGRHPAAFFMTEADNR